MMEEREVRRIIQNYLLAAKRKSWKCFVPDCEQLAIGSHLLQKNGILDLISKDNHLYQIGIDAFKDERFKFERIGIREAFSFPGFCNNHDNDIFKTIECSTIDFNDYRTHLLFSYRILANERRKKEILISWYSTILRDIRLQLILDSGYFDQLRRSIRGHNQALKDIDYYLTFFNKDLQDLSSRSFSFLVFEVPKIDLCVSSVFTYETTLEQINTPSFLVEKPLTDIYFSVIPQEQKSVAILGTLNEMKEKCWDFITSTHNEDINVTLGNISNLIITRVENWLCSESFYQRISKFESTIVREIHNSIRTLNEHRQASINLFAL